MRAMMIALLLASAPTAAFAKTPAAQGRACDARTGCDGGLSCVKDGGDMVCRPINDGVGLATATELKTPAGQGRACDAKSRCDGELQCVKHRDGKATCELVCAASTKCPEDQRCVKDAGEMLCRPITDL
ncbi:MAG TPA: hypothetical protein VGH63_03680 [Polyangia bacterium]